MQSSVPHACGLLIRTASKNGAEPRTLQLIKCCCKLQVQPKCSVGFVSLILLQGSPLPGKSTATHMCSLAKERIPKILVPQFLSILRSLASSANVSIVHLVKEQVPLISEGEEWENIKSVAYFEVGRFAGRLEKRMRRISSSVILGTCSKHFGECTPLL